MTGGAGGSARQAIIEAAIRLMEERPPSSISGRELADEAGVNYGLVHYYFGSREAAFRAARAHHSAWVVDEVMEGGTRPVPVEVTSGDRSIWAVAGHMALESDEAWSGRDRVPVVEAYLGLLTADDPEGDPIHHATVVAALYALQLGWPVFGTANARDVGLAEADIPAVRARLHELVGRLQASAGLAEPT